MLTVTQFQQATKRRALRMGWVRSVNKQRTQRQYTAAAAATATGVAVRAKSRRVSNT